MKKDENVRGLILELRRLTEDPAGKDSLRLHAAAEIFVAPAQAVVFEFSQPDYTVIFFTHIERPDQEVRFAAAGSFAELLHVLPEKLALLENTQIRHRWELSLSNMHRLIEENLRRLFVSLAEEICRQEHAKFRISPSPDVATLEVRGRLLDIDPKAIVTQLLADATRPHICSPRPFKSDSRERNAHAGSIFPLTVVGDEKTLTFEEEVRNEWSGPERWDISPQSWTTSCQQLPLVVFAGGMVAADTPHLDKAMQAINTFLAACQYFGHDCVPMTSYDLGHVSINAAGSVGSWGGPVEVSKRIFTSTKNLPEKTLRQIFDLPEKCNDKDSFAQLRLWHTGCSHFLSGENLQAFVLGWTTVENLIGRTWREYLGSCGIESGRFDKLTSPQGGFTVDHVIEFLNLTGRINSARYTQLQSLRKIRNKTVHSGLEPVTEDTGNCLRAAVEMLSDRIDPYMSARANSAHNIHDQRLNPLDK